jgi:hypothetical protein
MSELARSPISEEYLAKLGLPTRLEVASHENRGVDAALYEEMLGFWPDAIRDKNSEQEMQAWLKEKLTGSETGEVWLKDMFLSKAKSIGFFCGHDELEDGPCSDSIGPATRPPKEIWARRVRAAFPLVLQDFDAARHARVVSQYGVQVVGGTLTEDILSDWRERIDSSKMNCVPKPLYNRLLCQGDVEDFRNKMLDGIIKALHFYNGVLPLNGGMGVSDEVLFAFHAQVPTHSNFADFSGPKSFHPHEGALLSARIAQALEGSFTSCFDAEVRVKSGDTVQLPEVLVRKSGPYVGIPYVINPAIGEMIKSNGWATYGAFVDDCCGIKVSFRFEPKPGCESREGSSKTADPYEWITGEGFFTCP